MFACYGNAVRDYAFASSNGRLTHAQIQQNYLAKCITVITNCGDDNLSGHSRTPMEPASRTSQNRIMVGVGIFRLVQAFDIVVAYQFNPKPEYMDAIVRNLNYEGGCNPVNISVCDGPGLETTA